MSGSHAFFGSVSAATWSHVPSTPEPFFAAVHASHPEVHAVSQHTPSTQNPLLHSWAATHVPPLELLATHAAALHQYPSAHVVSSMHVVAQVEEVAQP
jgi:hypothetical protein